MSRLLRFFDILIHMNNLDSNQAPSNMSSTQESFSSSADVATSISNTSQIQTSSGYNIKLYLIIGFLFIVGIAVTLFVLIQARLQSFNTAVPNTWTTDISESSPDSQNPEVAPVDNLGVFTPSVDTSFVDCALPFVTIDAPQGGEVFRYGDTIIFDWSMCGISQSLFDNAVVSYFDIETGLKQGEIDLSCTDAEFDFTETQISWVVPERLSPANYSCPLVGIVDFMDGFVFQFEISYARSQYTSVTPDTFRFDVTNFVFEPPMFSQHPVQTTDFSRALLLDVNVPQVFQERISPAFFQAPTNFANFYRTFQLSCGPNCVSENILVDFRTGTIVIAPRALAVLTAVDSSLFVTEDASYDNLQDRDALISWYTFGEDTKNFTLFERKLCNASGLPTSRLYTDCIEP